MTATPPSPDQNPPTADQSRPPQPGWAPPPLSAGGNASVSGPQPVSGPDPRRPPSAEISRFAPRRSLIPALVAVIGVALAITVGYTALHPPTPQPTASPSASPTAKPTPRDGTPFATQYDDATGVWKIGEKRWDTTGLSVFVTVTLDTGDLDLSFNALPYDGQEPVYADVSALRPIFPAAPLSAGETASGWVHFPIKRSTTLVYLRTRDQAQISGIEVVG